MKYWVDWYDPTYPEIRLISEAEEHETPLTLIEAKREIIERAQQNMIQWQTLIRRTRQIRAADINKGRNG